MRLFALLGLAVLVSGCATTGPAPAVKVVAANAAAVASAGSYAWVPDRSGMAANPLNNADVWRGVVREAVEAELASAGHAKGEGRSAGFVMAFHLVIKDATSTTVIDNYFGYDAPGVRTHLDAFLKDHADGREGTLVIDAVDPKAKKLLWRGSATTQLNPNLSVPERKAAIRALVGAVLKDFPERKK